MMKTHCSKHWVTYGKGQLLSPENLQSKQTKQRKQEDEKSVLQAGDLLQFPVLPHSFV